MNTTAGTLITAVVLLVVMVWFDARCLTDLARTRDEDLYYLNRRAWALLIVVTYVDDSSRPDPFSQCFP